MSLFKARLLAGTCLPWMPREAVRDLVAKVTLAAYRIVRPGTRGAQRMGCPCQSERSVNDACDFHGLAVRRLIHGR